METKIVYFDTETTGLPPRGGKWDIDFKQFPNIVQLAWVTSDGKENSHIIKPDGWIVPEETTAIHGISQDRAMTEGIPFEKALAGFIEDCKNADVIVAHNIYFDTSIIKAMTLRVLGREYYNKNEVELALDKNKRIDTMKTTIKFVGAKYPDGRPGKYPRLEELYDKLFPGEKFPAHDALEDVRALVRCTPELVKLGIIELAQKPTETTPGPKKMKIEKRGIQFNDPNPVIKPVGAEIPTETMTNVESENGKTDVKQLLEENEF